MHATGGYRIVIWTGLTTLLSEYEAYFVYCSHVRGPIDASMTRAASGLSKHYNYWARFYRLTSLRCRGVLTSRREGNGV